MRVWRQDREPGLRHTPCGSLVECRGAVPAGGLGVSPNLTPFPSPGRRGASLEAPPRAEPWGEVGAAAGAGEALGVSTTEPVRLGRDCRAVACGDWLAMTVRYCFGGRTSCSQGVRSSMTAWETS